MFACSEWIGDCACSHFVASSRLAEHNLRRKLFCSSGFTNDWRLRTDTKNLTILTDLMACELLFFKKAYLPWNVKQGHRRKTI